MNRKKDRKKLVISLIFGSALLFAYLIVADLATKLTGSIFENPQIDQLATFATQVITGIIAYMFMKKMYNIKLGPSCKNMVVGMFDHGAAAWIFICLNMYEVTLRGYTMPELPITKVIFIVSISLLYNIGIGLAEEMIFRGIFFNSFKRFFGDTNKGIILSMILSSAMFGVVHVVNLTGHPELIVSTIAQMIYAILFGAMFCVVYYRTGNLWPGIILHGLIDFVASDHVFTDLNPAMVKADDTVFMGILSVAMVFLAFITALVQFHVAFKDKKVKALEANV